MKSEKMEIQDIEIKGRQYEPHVLLESGEWRVESDSLGQVKVPANRLWGAQTQRSLEHFSIGQDLIPREMITAYATLKKAAANANHASG
jgi:fumarate hydratase class II